MPDILESGQWQMLSLVDDGAIRISLVSAVAARLEVTGTSGPPKYLGPAHDVVAFPTGAVGDRGPVGVRVRNAAGEPFPGDGTIDLAVDSTGGGHSFLLKRVPVAGRISAPVLQLSRREGGIIARPGEGGGATTGLGGWCAKRRAEQGRPLRPTVTDVVIDTSSSMRRFAPRVEALTRFLNDLYVTAEVAGPTIHRAVIAGARNDGVGCVEAGPGGGADGGRRIVVTDLPLPPGQGECLVVGAADLSTALPGDAYTPPPEVWEELARTDAAFTRGTLEALAPLLDWLSPSSSRNGAD